MAGTNADVAKLGGGHFGLPYHDSEERRISVEVRSDFVGRHVVEI